jgi:putative oxidoreductase
MALGFLNPIGPLLSISAMAMATAKVHWNKPIWGTKGGPELPVTNAAIATAVGIGGPGKYSLDRLFRIRIPTSILAIIFSATTLVLAYGISQKPEPQNQTGGGNA